MKNSSLKRIVAAQVGRRLFSFIFLASGLFHLPVRAQSLNGLWHLVGFEFDSSASPQGVGSYERFASSGTVTFTALGGDNYRVVIAIAGEAAETQEWLLPRVGNMYSRSSSEAPENAVEYRETLRIVALDNDTMTLTYSGGDYWMDTAFPHHPNRIFAAEAGAFVLRRTPFPGPTTSAWAGNLELVEHGGAVTSFTPASTELEATSQVNIGVTESGGFTIARGAGGAAAAEAQALTVLGNALIAERTVASVGNPRIFDGPPLPIFGRNAHEALVAIQVDAQRVAVVRYRAQLGNPDLNLNFLVVQRAEVSVGVGVRTQNSAPAITQQPVDLAVVSGGDGFVTVAATGGPAPTFRWERSTDEGATWSALTDGDAYAGTGTKTLVVRRPTPAAPDHRFRVRVSNSTGTVTSDAARLRVLATPTARLPNLSLRTDLAAGQTLIVGFVMRGGTKPLMLRAVGPTLSAFNLSGVQADPLIELYGPTGERLLENDDWNAADAAVFSRVGAFDLTPGSRDAALGVTLQGAATAQVRGKVGGGVVLVEVYDAGMGNDTRLANVSARNFVGTGEQILIAGFVITGDDPKNILIRAVGPSLKAFGVSGTLADPALEIYDSAGNKVAANDNWDASLGAVGRSAGGFDLLPASRDAALLVTLRPGAYTAQVRGADGGTGEALVELYELP